jgi:hypothetical protein
MKFLITMNMPSRNNPVHQIICEYPAKGLREFCDALESREFTVVEEFYKNASSPYGSGADAYYSIGFTALNYQCIGKIREFANVTSAQKNIEYGDGYEQKFRKNDAR